VSYIAGPIFPGEVASATLLALMTSAMAFLEQAISKGLS
jgi:hypothetical protein